MKNKINTNDVTSGFDYLRYFLSFSVIFIHSFGVVSGGDFAVNFILNNNLHYLTLPVLPMFFALSGFLVTSSLLRSRNIMIFLWMRVIRIYPALMVEVILSAILLGAILTSNSLPDYFSNSVFYEYLWNIVGYVHYKLPGVFENNPVKGVVNISLWTIPYELECYIGITIFSLLGLMKKPRLSLFILIALSVMHCFYVKINLQESIPTVALGGSSLILFFLAGVCINLNKDIIPHSWLLFFTTSVVGFYLLSQPLYSGFAALPIAYTTIWLGLLKPKKVPLLMGGDYSYGSYLYAFPIQQMMFQLTDVGKIFLGNFILSLSITLIFSVFSWHFIEKPMLKFKSIFS